MNLRDKRRITVIEAALRVVSEANAKGNSSAIIPENLEESGNAPCLRRYLPTFSFSKACTNLNHHQYIC